MTILICEDEEIMLTALEFRLKRQGFTVLRAEDGRKAIDIVNTQSPDLIIADIMMPHVTGLDLIKYIRQDLKRETPIIVISALEMDEIVLNAFRLGANDFITKPFKPYELILRIRRIFQELEIEIG